MTAKAKATTDAAETWPERLWEQPEALSRFAAAATTSGAHERVKVALTHLKTAAEIRLQGLEAGREAAALSGTIDAATRETWELGERIKSFQVAIDAAERRRDAAETAEIQAAMEESAAKGRARVPEAVKAWERVAAAYVEVTAATAALTAIEREIDGLCAHATRAKRRDLIVGRGEARGEAAARIPRPDMGMHDHGIVQEHDNIRRLAVLALEAVNEVGVHNRDAHAINRNPIGKRRRDRRDIGLGVVHTSADREVA